MESLAAITGLRDILGLLQPLTPWGREQKRSLAPFPPAEHAALERALGDVEAAMGLAPMEELKDILSRFREIRGTAEGLSSGAALTETELFEVKRFLLTLQRLNAALAGQRPPECYSPPDLNKALALLDPSGSGDEAFSLAALDGELRALNRAWAALAPGTEERAALETERARRERAVAEALTQGLLPFQKALLRAAEAVGALDLALAKAALARLHGGVKPEFCQDELILQELVHPAIAGFTPISLTLPRGATVLTGANMGGKSTALYTAYCGVWMALSGLYPFARQVATPHFHGVECVLNAGGCLGGLSDFAAQGEAVLRALSRDNGNLLLLMDEPARGTNPLEGTAIVQALIKRLSQSRSVSLVATHFPGAAALAQAHYRAKGLKAGADSLSGAVQYGFEPAGACAAPPRDAITVLRLLGADEGLLADAEKFIDNLKGPSV